MTRGTGSATQDGRKVQPRCPICGGPTIEATDGWKCREYEGYKDELASRNPLTIDWREPRASPHYMEVHR